jgi:type I restriction enzyme S subunit
VSWPIAQIGDLVTVRGGGTPPREIEAYFQGSIPWVTPKDMKSWEISDSQLRLTSQAIDHSPATVVPSNTVLLVVRSGVLKHTVPVAINRRPVSLNQDMKSLECNGRLLPEFLARYLKASEPTILGWVRATTADNYPIERIRKLEIPLPGLEEQRRIAKILDIADELRRKRSVTIKRLDELAKSVFLELFGDPRGNPMRWPQLPLSELFAAPPIFGTMTPATKERKRWICLRVANIQDWKIDLSDTKYVDLPSSVESRHTVRDGDIVLARAIASRDHLGKCVVVYPAGAKWAFDSHLMRLRFDTSRVLPEYVRDLWMTPGGRALFLSVTRKTTIQYNVNTKEISTLVVPVPPLECQSKFVESVRQIDGLKAANFEHLGKLDTLFTSLQHRAFRGEL